MTQNVFQLHKQSSWVMWQTVDHAFIVGDHAQMREKEEEEEDGEREQEEKEEEKENPA